MNITTINLGLENNPLAELTDLLYTVMRLVNAIGDRHLDSVHDIEIRRHTGLWDGQPERTLVIRFKTGTRSETAHDLFARDIARHCEQTAVAWSTFNTQHSELFGGPSNGLTYADDSLTRDQRMTFDAEYFIPYESNSTG